MSRSLEDIIAECDRRMAECEITSPTDEIKRLKEELARKERELDEIKSRMIESEKIVREYAIIQETKRRQEEEYFSKFSSITLTIYSFGHQRYYECNAIKVATKYYVPYMSRSAINLEYYLTDTGYLIELSSSVEKKPEVIDIYNGLTARYLSIDDKQRLSQRGCSSCHYCREQYMSRYRDHESLLLIFCMNKINKPCIIDLDWLKVHLDNMYVGSQTNWLL
jgi:hypothetical protein